MVSEREYNRFLKKVAAAPEHGYTYLENGIRAAVILQEQFSSEQLIAIDNAIEEQAKVLGCENHHFIKSYLERSERFANYMDAAGRDEAREENGYSPELVQRMVDGRAFAIVLISNEEVLKDARAYAYYLQAKTEEKEIFVFLRRSLETPDFAEESEILRFDSFDEIASQMRVALRRIRDGKAN